MDNFKYNKNMTNLLKDKFPVLYAVSETVHEMLFILDHERRIVFFNRQFADFAKSNQLNPVTGVRPGDVFRCVNALENADVCGETKFCRYCGAYQAITAALTDTERHIEECRITAENGIAYDLKVSTSRINIETGEFTLFCVLDTSAENRKQALEKIFFHDINNLAGGLTLIVDFIDSYAKKDDLTAIKETTSLLTGAMSSLNNELRSSYMLALAEKDELDLQEEPCDIKKALVSVAAFFKETTLDKSITFVIETDRDETIIDTDENILKRIVTNMTKNAVEASSDGDKVIMGSRVTNDRLIIYVQNNFVMKEETKASIFQRSFTTKGIGRGLGTYSMRLLTERYLKGAIYFCSTEETGTVFYIELPLSLSGR
ncbi:MAG: sensor histidine kinase [Deferribacterales bacterium]